MTDKDSGAILVLSSYETRERQALTKEAMELSVPPGAGKPAEVRDNILSFSLWPNAVSGRGGKAKEAVSTLPSLAGLATVGRFYLSHRKWASQSATVAEAQGIRAM